MGKPVIYRGVTLSNRSRRQNGWHLTYSSRTRWGTMAEMKHDVDHIKNTGKLPERKLGWA